MHLTRAQLGLICPWSQTDPVPARPSSRHAHAHRHTGTKTNDGSRARLPLHYVTCFSKSKQSGLGPRTKPRQWRQRELLRLNQKQETVGARRIPSGKGITLCDMQQTPQNAKEKKDPFSCLSLSHTHTLSFSLTTHKEKSTCWALIQIGNDSLMSIEAVYKNHFVRAEVCN